MGTSFPDSTNNTRSQHTQPQIDAMLSFARCIRGRGFPRFPDPTSTGTLDHEMLAQARINLHQPAMVHAADDCVSVTDGSSPGRW